MPAPAEFLREPDHRQMTITPGHGWHHIHVNGTDISHSVTTAVLWLHPGQAPRITLELAGLDLAPITVDPTVVRLPDETVTALTALGWTPPTCTSQEPA